MGAYLDRETTAEKIEFCTKFGTVEMKKNRFAFLENLQSEIPILLP